MDLDPGHDPAGGAFVSWSVGPTLLKQIREPTLSGDHHGAALLHFGVIHQAMEQALWVILTSAGRRVESANDEYRPYALRVIVEHEDEKRSVWGRTSKIRNVAE
ncbi:hypothetical protein ACTMTF_36770 [Nonomuraea sp. ZG12]|uniref:hypothetical protein n=1 Tax=Nonomuraea sp. ZG12 TaxID=3452207 RepID=UPI003F89846E